MNAKVFNLMSGVDESRFFLGINQVSVNVDWMKVYVIQRKNGIVIKLGVMIVVYVKKIICGILAHVTVIVKNHVKLMNI